MRHTNAFALLLVLSIAGCNGGGGGTSAEGPVLLRFAVVGDYGIPGPSAASDVAALVASWAPDHVITTGDNNYDTGSAATIDGNIGAHYATFIHPYTGAFGTGATANRFWPSLGNHDWMTAGAQPYLDYFALPGNERYYDFVAGPVHFFALDSDTSEPDGVTADSAQGQWLEARLAASTACWKVVYMHHPPYTSGSVHASTAYMQWPFGGWGADIVLAGHVHNYERLDIGGLPYIVNGAGGRALYASGSPIAGSLVQYSADHGAQRVTMHADSMTLEFFSRSGTLIDSLMLTKDCPG